MKILDKVHSTFSRLDRDFARSKKSRSDFIQDKFGGDIDIGSMLILEAITQEINNSEAPTNEDISKLSAVRDIFGAIKRHRNHLDSLSSFAFLDEDMSGSLVNVLNSAQSHGSHIHVMNQGELGKNVHYRVTASDIKVVPLSKCETIKLYNDNMRLFASHVSGLELEIGDTVKQTIGGYLSLA